MLKRFMDKKSGFTLTELLIALTIIGAVSAMAIPNLIDGIHRRSLMIQVKNNYEAIQEVAREQLATKNTKNLMDTDFASPAKLLRDKNFQISKKCTNGADCWSAKYKRLSDKTVTTRVVDEKINTGKSVILKNGTILTYTTDLTTNYPVMKDGDKVIGMFRIDVNGADKPNFIGRDVFWFLITRKGKVVDFYTATNKPYVKSTALAECKSATTITSCLALVMRSGWVMDY